MNKNKFINFSLCLLFLSIIINSILYFGRDWYINNIFVIISKIIFWGYVIFNVFYIFLLKKYNNEIKSVIEMNKKIVHIINVLWLITLVYTFFDIFLLISGIFYILMFMKSKIFKLIGIVSITIKTILIIAILGFISYIYFFTHDKELAMPEIISISPNKEVRIELGVADAGATGGTYYLYAKNEKKDLLEKYILEVGDIFQNWNGLMIELC